MLSNDEGYAIHEAIKRSTSAELRAKVREYPEAQKEIARIRAKELEHGFPESPIDEEWLISVRYRDLIGRLIREEITMEERREFVTLQFIRVELMRPDVLRRFRARRAAHA